MSSIQQGGVYVIKNMNNGGKYEKIKIVKIVETDTSGYVEGLGYMPSFVLDVHYVVMQGSQQGQRVYVTQFDFEARKVKRKTHCWSCQRNLNEYELDVCPECGWIKCPHDNACGCNYKGGVIA